MKDERNVEKEEKRKQKNFRGYLQKKIEEGKFSKGPISQPIRPTICWKDNSNMVVLSKIRLRTGKQIPVYTCPTCQLTLIHTSREEDIRDINTRCYIYGRIVPSKCFSCNSTLIRTDEYVIGKEGYRRLKYCKGCKLFYVPYEMYRDIARRDWKPQNSPEQLNEIKVEMDLLNQKPEKKCCKNTKNNLNSTEIAKRVPIAFKDFVIRRSVFKCKKAGHNLQNITGIVKIMGEKGEIKNVYIPAGYCPVCDKYIIMESTYCSLKDKGIILCRISDEKSYLNSDRDIFFNTDSMAQRSILKQCGYSVAQNSYLTSDNRKKLLCMIIDNGILQSSEVISYLDWFIRTRDGQHNLKNAVERWQSDLDFIREKYSPDWGQYRVRSIRR